MQRKKFRKEVFPSTVESKYPSVLPHFEVDINIDTVGAIEKSGCVL